jgi:plastocyanin
MKVERVSRVAWIHRGRWLDGLSGVLAGSGACLALLVLAVAILGCAGSEPKATSPEESPTVLTTVELAPSPTVSPTETMVVSPTAAPTEPVVSTPTFTVEPTAATTAQPTQPPSPTESLTNAVTVNAQGLLFLNSEVTARAGEVTVTLNNLDASVPHDVTIDGTESSAGCTGPCSASFNFTGPPGDYKFHCSYHPDMTGVLHLVP